MSYIGQILYVTSLGCVKISLLLFLQRIFPTKVMRRVVRGLLIFVLCFSVTNVFLFAFQCDTPEYYFTKIKGDAQTNGGVCLAPQVVYYPMAAINILTDVVIWLLPVPMIIKARLSNKEKLGLLWVFLIGGVYVNQSLPLAARADDLPVPWVPVSSVRLTCGTSWKTAIRHGTWSMCPSGQCKGVLPCWWCQQLT
jgi:hypothetical protein